MNIGSYFQLALYFTMCVLIFTLSVNLVDGMGVFSVDGSPVHIEKGVAVSGNESDIIYQVTGLSGGAGYIFTLGLGLGAVASVGLAWATKQTIPIGIYIFASVFWTSWIRCYSIFDDIVDADLLLIGFVVMFMIFVAAIAGLLSGGG